MTTTTQSQLYDELRAALAKTNSEDMKAWGKASAARLPRVFARRVKNLGNLVVNIARGTGKELGEAFKAWRDGRFGTHLGDRTAATIDSSAAIIKRVASAIGAVGSALLNDPKKTAADVFALALGFYAGGGGVDGDGGIPDTDLALGIGWHRSIFTHSIIAGTIAEGAILALADLADVVIEKLPPEERHPFWSTISATKASLADKLTKGVSAGIAYHLAVDGTLQPAAYHDLPVSMPMEGHETIILVNSAGEAIDIGNKEPPSAKKERSAGEKTVDVARNAAKRTSNFISDFKAGFNSA